MWDKAVPWTIGWVCFPPPTLALEFNSVLLLGFPGRTPEKWSCSFSLQTGRRREATKNKQKQRMWTNSLLIFIILVSGSVTDEYIWLVFWFLQILKVQLENHSLVKLHNHSSSPTSSGIGFDRSKTAHTLEEEKKVYKWWAIYFNYLTHKTSQQTVKMSSTLTKIPLEQPGSMDSSGCNLGLAKNGGVEELTIRPLSLPAPAPSYSRITSSYVCGPQAAQAPPHSIKAMI